MSASLLKKVQKRSEERKFGGTHPILRMGLDRNVIDAYFTGLVFAAVADDEAVDEAERAKLEKIGLALNLYPEDVRGIVDEMLARDGDAKVAVAEEAAGEMKGKEAIQLFLCEWSQIWMSHDYRPDDLDEFRRQLCEWLGCDCDEVFFRTFDAAVMGVKADADVILPLLDTIPDEHLAYLFADCEVDVAALFAEERMRRHKADEAKRKAAAKAKKAAAAAKIEGFFDEVSAYSRPWINNTAVTRSEMARIGKDLSVMGYGDVDKASLVRVVSDRYLASAHEIERRIERRIDPLWKRYGKSIGTMMFGPKVSSSEREQCKDILYKTLWCLIGICATERDLAVAELKVINGVLRKAHLETSVDFVGDGAKAFWQNHVRGLVASLLGVDVPNW